MVRLGELRAVELTAQLLSAASGEVWTYTRFNSTYDTETFLLMFYTKRRRINVLGITVTRHIMIPDICACQNI